MSVIKSVPEPGILLADQPVSRRSLLPLAVRRQRCEDRFQNFRQRGVEVSAEDSRLPGRGRGWRASLALVVGIAALGVAGCGDSDTDSVSSEAQERIERGAEEAKKGIEEAKKEVEKGFEEAGDEAKKGVQQGTDSAQEGIEEGKSEAKQGIEKAEKEAQRGIEKGKEEAEQGIEEAESQVQQYGD
ncbi:MAG TPA: hypothetical protein VN752_07885 [Solirubrobacterales bacterium]|nr:hypothetical protein [Solirubrobacterales bacterium]